ncbi:sucrase ferredoxin [Nocardioides sp. ChNu-99]|uniref:sucrase ferredoxin n=1 Tax=Nocardioides sp. ChNu-99 TaxID=2839897 RepID=UPI002406BF4E|nr:sucrase ferredoxin [Nocardioides sp. ChNu-99]MDF9717483.1 sucrase ferredoxin [Nocardioides sp. ChNu-99]
MTFRCAAASAADDEPLAGTAPTDDTWLLVEQPGPWGRKALRESDLPPEVAAHLGGLRGVRVQLVRRPGRRPDGPRHVFAARREGAGYAVTAALLPDLAALLGTRADDVARGALPGAAPYPDPLWLVCTNGRRDLCCAELGRPVAQALADRWPEATWETTHLGGHRFSATLVALPSGVALGRLDPGGAVAACAALADGHVPLEVARGAAGLPAAAQAAELHVRATTGLTALDAVRVLEAGDDEVVLAVAGGGGAEELVRCRVASRPGAARRQSCGDEKTGAAPVWEVVTVP